MQSAVLSITLLAAALAAQSPVPQSPAALAGKDATTRKGVVTDVDADGRIWVAGNSYKASFGRDGTTFVPFLGAAAPGARLTATVDPDPQSNRCSNNTFRYSDSGSDSQNG